ncbi:hypothetical protein GCM10008014_20900 [Paenibacillus silvae]|uniref:Uncharacterized protein n=1 Tax=Paenibacillus silvae TaxID=1325358 RepID=A0ABQ1Z7X2_9BACL|nr:hypothetical protein [Paenibacillus silvae]GGH53317.1 hypothetical protein GCM10008014_20900 [Paenibacillus silvae]
MESLVRRFKSAWNHQEFRVYVIESSAVKRFLVVEFILSYLVYKMAFYVCHNDLLAGASTWAGTEGVKRLPMLFRRIAGV